MRLSWLGSFTVLLAGMGCSDETGGSADAPSNAGNGGTSAQDDQSPTAGLDGSPGSSTDTLPDVGTLLRAAVVVGSCVPDDGINRSLTRMAAPGWYPTSLPISGEAMRCLATHGDGCDAVATCLGYELSTEEREPCDACVDSVAHYCGDGAHLALDCSILGGQCDPAAGCVSELPVVACDESSFTPSCDASGRPVVCDGGYVQSGADCAALGLVCDSGECVGQGAECFETSLGDSNNSIPTYEGIECVGDMLHSCVGGRSHETDCSSLGDGYTCQTIPSGSPSCAGNACPPMVYCGIADECVPGEQPPASEGSSTTCDGTEVHFCNAGRIESMDCSLLGFDGCRVDRGYYGCTSS